MLLVHADFLPIVESLRDKLERLRTFVPIDDEGIRALTRMMASAGEYEALPRNFVEHRTRAIGPIAVRARPRE